MDALIAGAGIGGLALARGLVADGHRVRVLEKAAGLRLGGAAVTIFSNGAAALAGLGAPLNGLGGPIDLLEFRPSQAQGANQALEDAWLLTRALRRTGAPAEALRRYERLRTPRVRRVSAMAASEVTNRPPRTVAKLAAHLLPPSLSGRAYLALVRRFSSVLSDETP
ncbi:hypothetical protein HC031_18000 [Planosporangium thailandense]|uniref:FAD-binding domain-containing protein n=1 Tax=Planosporangium thailandense TaxID=765197 RepID=A0ABX0Y0M7_9ACTN|nr:NAD(P)-binding protein [Planosporangium thailandense]NJC71598.1 hypothetical protein [Planosporangium thailandense]